jgi:hypothetical protein
VSDYATPDVAVQLLPGVSAAIVTSLNNHSPAGGTPTEPALTGALQYASAYAGSLPVGGGGAPSRKVIVVLATDGDPNDCSSDVAGVSAIAGAGYAASPSIQTFVIGVGSSLTSLNAIAQAGGTGQAFIVDTASNPTQQFIDAMNQIRTVSQQTDAGVSTTVPCEWVMPAVPAGHTVDQTRLAINGTGIAFTGAASCGSVTQDAWYYDNPTNPKKAVLCPSTCTWVKAVSNPTVEMTFGCSDHPIAQ